MCIERSPVDLTDTMDARALAQLLTRMDTMYTDIYRYIYAYTCISRSC